MDTRKPTGDGDTIIAVITPPGEGGIAAIRLAGRGSRSYLKKFFVSPKRGVPFKPFVMRYGTFVSSDGKALDEITAVYMPKGRSYTGLEQVEIFCHGGRQIVQQIQQELVRAGARPAEPGEFTRLAFLNGNIDLARAEAVAEIIAANTARSYQVGREHLLGSYSEHIEQMRTDLLEVTAEVEAGIDFTEQEIDLAPAERLAAMIGTVIGRIKSLAGSYDGGRIINEGFRVVIGGRPNVGKSSLFNLLLRQQRALVNPSPGTTRDYLSEWIDLDGFAVNLIDTAGLRIGGGAVERDGQAHAHDIISGADLLLWMVDLSKRNCWANLRKDLPALSARLIVLIGNKIDLLPQVHPRIPHPHKEALLISCLTGKGTSALKKALSLRISARMPDLTSGLVVTSARHRQKLGVALKNLQLARRKIKTRESLELAAFDLRQATSALGEITGQVYTEDILDRIFSRFCIGK